MIKSNYQYQRGVTLVELMIGLVIVGVVLTFGLPAAQGIINKNRIVSEINEISGVIQFARATAVDEQILTIVCPTANFSTCSTDWSQVKMVFADEDGNGSRGNDEEILVATSLISSNNYANGPNQSIQFLPNGSANVLSTILLCHSSKDAAYARELTVTPQGRVKISQDANKDGVHENISGNALSCP
ncbi:GspH/FimT family pseudopilin [Aliiglaciecola sp. M165]|uniref:GspH/FimT family pseudopilin n=1 Tax=Aliiglaciecola sp. M165 TaxID=2593649 RepID=UPI00117CBB0D|nr:GspH/FimT family pseudopilin [Aliiglaciecola sp. M165]TRY30842.1 prepilin-type N-terminal cleavage/methylation domain-containing protein [Aliiglaciecola sp. M165]